MGGGEDTHPDRPVQPSPCRRPGAADFDAHTAATEVPLWLVPGSPPFPLCPALPGLPRLPDLPVSSPRMEHPPGPNDRPVAAAIAIGLFAIYAAGACRTVYVGDSGELVTAVHVLGIPHPSGYPLYVQLGKLWTLLVPIGSIAFRMSLFSAACAAATCALLYVTVRQDGGSRTAGLFGALVLAFAPSFWQEANIQRVYALNALFVILALNRALAWHRERQSRDLVIAMFLCGLGATNHTVMALVGVAIAAWAPLVETSLFWRPRVVAGCAAGFVAGLLPYLYLPIRSRMNPVLNWGEPKTLDAFLDVVLRRDFWHRAWWEGPADLGPILSDFVKSLGPETGFAGAMLAIVALVARPGRKWVLPLLVVALNVAAVAKHGSYYDVFVWHRYHIPAYLAVILLGTAGLDAILRKIVARRLAALALAVPAVMLAGGWHEADRSRHTYAADYARSVLDSLPPGAKLLANDDNVLFALLYLRYVEGMRPDVELFAEGVSQRRPDLFFDPDADQIFFAQPSTWRVEGLEFVPRGVVVQAVRAGTPWPEPIDVGAIAREGDASVHRDFLTRTLLAHGWFMQGWTWEARDWSRADEALRRARDVAPDYPLTLYNASLIYARNGFYDEAIDLLRQAGAVDPRGLLGPAGSGEQPGRVVPSSEERRVTAERERIRALEARISAAIGGEIEPGSAEWHRVLSRRFAELGELAPARYHQIQATPSNR